MNEYNYGKGNGRRQYLRMVIYYYRCSHCCEIYIEIKSTPDPYINQ